MIDCDEQGTSMLHFDMEQCRFFVLEKRQMRDAKLQFNRGMMNVPRSMSNLS